MENLTGSQGYAHNLGRTRRLDRFQGQTQYQTVKRPTFTRLAELGRSDLMKGSYTFQLILACKGSAGATPAAASHLVQA